MRTIPVDADRFAERILTVVETVPANDYDTGNQKMSPDGLPIWTVRVLTRDGDDPTRRPELTEVKVPSRAEPKLNPGDRPRFLNLVGLVWSGDNGGGCSLRADGFAGQAQHQKGEKQAA